MTWNGYNNIKTKENEKMKTFYNEFCKAMYFLILGILLSISFHFFNNNPASNPILDILPDVRSLESSKMVVPFDKSTPLDSNFLHMLELPSLIDIQRKLNELEPNDPLKVDGRWGKLTCDKWDRVYCNEQAKKYFEGNEK